MITLSPPPPPLLIEPPAIIRPLEGGLYGTLDGQMQRLGLPRGVRRSVMAEMAKVVGGKPGLLRATAAEMAHYSKDPSLASMLLNPFLVSTPPSGPTVTFIVRRDGGTTGGGTSPQTEININVGAAGAKLVAVSAHSIRNAAAVRTLTSANIDGTNGTIAGQAGNNDGVDEGTQCGLAYREITTGGNITIILTWSAAMSCSVLNVWTITNYVSNVHDDFKAATGNDPTITTLTTAAASCVLAAAGGVQPSTGAMSFSGVSLDLEGQSSAGPVAFMRAGCGHSTGLSASVGAYNVGMTSTAGFEVVTAMSFH